MWGASLKTRRGLRRCGRDNTPGDIAIPDEAIHPQCPTGRITAVARFILVVPGMIKHPFLAGGQFEVALVTGAEDFDAVAFQNLSLIHI